MQKYKSVPATIGKIAGHLLYEPDHFKVSVLHFLDEATAKATNTGSRDMVFEALDLIADVANVTFEGVRKSHADFTVGVKDVPFSGLYRPTPSPKEAWLDVDYNTYDSVHYGGWGFQILLHEIGHAVGLNHPGDYNAGDDENITYETHAEYWHDTFQYSLMSYFGPHHTGGDWKGQYAATPMLFDIQALQWMFTQNTTTRLGDNTYGYGASGEGMRDAFDFSINTSPVVTIYDMGGIDTLDLSSSTEDAVVDLNEAAFSSTHGMTNNIAIAYDTEIENAVGGSGDDRIIGNPLDNRFVESKGIDSYEGGGGVDTLSFEESTRGQVIDVARGHALGQGGIGEITRFDSIERFLGSRLADEFRATDADDTFLGGGGDDAFIFAGSGTDRFEGGGGRDEIDLTAAGPSRVFLYADLATVSGGGTVWLDSVEDVAGSEFWDFIVGDNASNELSGFGHNDHLLGLGGADTLLGHTGEDTLRGGSGADRLYGGSDDDLLYGDAGSDHIRGGSGDDTLHGGEGNDTFFGDEGSDLIVGGHGIDTVRYGIGDITDMSRTAAGYRIETADGVDTVEGVERIGITLNGTAESLSSFYNNFLADRLAPVRFDDPFKGGWGFDLADFL